MHKKAIVYSLVSLFLFQPWSQELNAINDSKKDFQQSINRQQYALGFDAIIEQTIDYLQGLKNELLLVAQQADKNDSINAVICTELAYLFNGNKMNAYALKTYLSKNLEEQARTIFNQQENIPTAIFCQALAQKCNELIKEFQETNIRILRKKYKANIARYQITPYPSEKKILLTISIHTTKSDQ